MGILIVDDSADALLLLESFLKKAGYGDITLAESAYEAIEYLDMDGSEGIDLILMDIMMPGMDGVEACRRIRKNTRLQDIPVIMVTAKAEGIDLKSAFDAGAVDYVTKPIKKIEFLTRIRSVLKLKHETDKRKARERELLEMTQKLDRANQRLEYLSYMDELTDIANRRYFEKHFDQEWKRAGRYSRRLSLIMIDIDFFKNYNDTYGHKEGDVCLGKVATALKHTLKRPGDFIARYGGEEFVAVLPDTDMTGAAVIAESMRSNVRSLGIEHNGNPAVGKVTISLGVASAAPESGQITSEALVIEADKAMYAAKQSGRNRVSVQQ
ncbi:MAG: diguanylate cyclase [Deltaproteobacteria bacterium]|nr:diguanylate cyclase [Deltaproteobacteria bacterium]